MKLEDLVKTINSRADADPSESWTAKLLAQGPEKCAEKFGEEAVEAIIEAVKGDNNALISEAADVILSAVKKKQWRILVGDDAKAIDEWVRSAPENAYNIHYNGEKRENLDEDI